MKTLGPAPALPRDPVLSPARLRVLEALGATPGPVTAAELATQLGTHENTVRDHLEALTRLGFATRQRRPNHGPGRPAWCYVADTTANHTDPRVREYASLALALAEQIARTSKDPVADSLAAGETWGRELARGRTARTPAQARRRVVELLAGLGFDPVADDTVTTIRLRRCPLLDAATARPDVVCPVHLGLVRGLLAALGGNADDARLLSFAEPGACRLELSPNPPTRTGASAS